MDRYMLICLCLLIVGKLNCYGFNSQQPTQELYFKIRMADSVSKDNQLAGIELYQAILKESTQLQIDSIRYAAQYGIINCYYRKFDYEKTYILSDSLLKQNPSLKYKMLASERKGDFHWYTGNFDSASHYYLKVNTLAAELKDTTKLATSYRDLGDYYRQTGNYEQAIKNFNESIKLLQSKKDTKILPGVYNNFSLVFESTGDYHKQLSYLIMALDLKKESDDFDSKALYNKNIANVYINLKEYNTALEKARESLLLIKKDPFKRFETYILETMGRAFYHVENYDSSKYYFHAALNLSNSLGEKRYQARINKCLGDIAVLEQDKALAKTYYDKSLNIYTTIKDPIYQIQTLIGLARISTPLQAVTLLKNAEDIALKYGNKGELIEIYLNLSKLYEQQSLIAESFGYLKKTDSLKDLVFTEDRARYIAVNEILYETKKQELENSLLKKNIANQEVQFGKQSNRLKLVMILIFAIIIITLSLYYAYRKTRLSKLKVAIQNKQLQEKNQEIEKANQQQIDLIHLVAHDLKAPLNKIQGLSSILKLNNHLDKEQTGIVEMMENIAGDSKRFIVNLLEAQDLERKALEPDIKYYDFQILINDCKLELQSLAQEKNQKVVYNNEVTSKAYIKIDKELMQHVLLNLFSNAIKFSPAGSSIFFEAKSDGDYLYLHVKDEGPGFTEDDKNKIFTKFQKLSAKPTKNESSSGLGLYLVKRLTNKMGVNITLEESNIGAHFKITIPYLKKLPDEVNKRST